MGHIAPVAVHGITILERYYTMYVLAVQVPAYLISVIHIWEENIGKATNPY